MPAPIHGRLAALDVAGLTSAAVSVYQVPALRKATVGINIVNRSGSAAQMRLAITSGAIGTLADSDWLEFDASIPAKEPLERTGITLRSGQSVVIGNSTGTFPTVNCVVWGIEEDA